MNDPADPRPTLHQLVCFNFYRGWREVSEFYRNVLPEGISLQQNYILEHCDASRGVLVSAIAQRLEIDKPAISGMLRRMEKSGLIRREVNPDNRRQTRVFLTDCGVRTRARIRESIADAEESMQSVLAPDDVTTLARIAEAIQQLNR